MSPLIARFRRAITLAAVAVLASVVVSVAAHADSSTTSQTSATSAAGNNPEGYLGAWSAGDGIIYFTGYAFDRDDFTKKVTTFYTLDGKVVAYQIAQLRSTELDPYGLPYNGVFGGIQAPTAGRHELCMFGNNIGAGHSGIISCVYLGVTAKNPRGDIAVEAKNNQIVINGWLIDDSDLSKSLGYWIFDNGQPVAYNITNAPSPYLYPYGVGGNHAFGTVYTPSTSGKHDICVLGQNTGFGQNTWIDCDTVSVGAAQTDPKGQLAVNVADYDGNGLKDVFIAGHAYDPNDPSQSLKIALFLDGKPVTSGIAEADSHDWNPSGIAGDHAYYTWLGEQGFELKPGAHEVCLLAYNIGAGSDKLVQCVKVSL